MDAIDSRDAKRFPCRYDCHRRFYTRLARANHEESNHGGVAR